ncbi:hypothetical protein D3C73_891030 [compost metagenome]
MVLKPSWLEDGLVSVWKPPLTVGSSGIARVTKLTTPPTFCGPYRTAPPPRTTSTASMLPMLIGANDSCG